MPYNLSVYSLQSTVYYHMLSSSSNPLEKLNLLPGSLSGRTAVVTGSGRGIGRELALEFARLGASVVIAELSDEGAETERLIRELDCRGLFVHTDISDPQSVAGLAQETVAAFGPVDYLINNAIHCPVASVLEMDVETWDRVMAVNLRGAFLASKAFLPGMLERGEGVIVNMVSTEAMPYLSAYIASKQGLVAFSRSLASELGDTGVNVVAFAPGFVDTPGLRGAAETLAPHLGLSPDQFLSMSFHPAYPGSMPVEDAAAATVYLAIKQAAEFHGEMTTGYELLEKAGYLPEAVVAEAFTASETPAPAVPPPGGSDAYQQALELSGVLLQQLAATAQEFDKLPIFIRPMARGGFRSKAGMSLADWQRSLDQLYTLLEGSLEGDAVAAGRIQKENPRLIAYLGKLAAYYTGVPAETARFTKDQEFLKEVQSITQSRLHTIRSLQEVLAVIG